jgi:hypothetical protein
MPRKATGKPNGRPIYRPTDDDRKTVELMCAVGIPHEGIAACIGDGIDDKTLRRHFSEELKTAKLKANAKIGGAIFSAAMNGNMTAAALWAKTQMGWRETGTLELTGKDGGPVQTIDVTKLSTQALAELVAARNAKTTDTE